MFKTQKFMQLFISDIVSSKLKQMSNFLGLNKRWQIAIKPLEGPVAQIGEDNLNKILQVFVNNGGE